MKVTCENCEGKGKVLVDGEWFTCENCNGKGWVEISDPEDSEENS